MYAIVDIETTGGSPKTEKITEIAIYVFDGHEVIREFSTLINPGRSIPEFISNMTGITNQMVAHAPRFFEVAKDIVECTESCIFVAHNASFDYGFVQEEFRSLGYTYQRKTLDTVGLSRKLIPGHASYSLGRLCDELGIRVQNRHRAGGDALATVELFKILLANSGGNSLMFIQAAKDKSLKTNPNLDWTAIDALPSSVGVYYLLDEKANLIYVGKSTNIHNRVLQHLANIGTEKARKMRDAIVTVSYEETGSELVALLLESAEIKMHLPLYNAAQKRTSYSYGMFASPDATGYLNMSVRKLKKDENAVLNFSSPKEGKAYLEKGIRNHELCQKLCGRQTTKGACFHHSIGQCKGACIGLESVEAYNARIQNFLNEKQFDFPNFFIIDRGRTDDERSVVQVHGGIYKGYGYTDLETCNSPEILADIIKPQTDNREVRQIIQTFMKNLGGAKVIRMDD
ncbi:MAG: hypothetical protein RIS47_1542 [Bacteroidota bacterium]